MVSLRKPFSVVFTMVGLAAVTACSANLSVETRSGGRIENGPVTRITWLNNDGSNVLKTGGTMELAWETAEAFPMFQVDIARSETCGDPAFSIGNIVARSVKVRVMDEGRFNVCLSGQEADQLQLLATMPFESIAPRSEEPSETPPPPTVTPAPAAVIQNAPKGFSNVAWPVVMVTGEGVEVYRWSLVSDKTDCSSATWSALHPAGIALPLSLSGEGTKTLCVLGGNGSGRFQESPTVASWYFDPVSPTLSLTTADGTAGIVTLTIEGTCESGLPVGIAGSGTETSVTTACTNGTFSSSVNFSAGTGVKQLTLTQTDAAGNSTLLTGSFIRIAPTAALSGAPTAFTNVSAYSLSVSGPGVATYSYGFITGSTDCDTASWSAPVAVSIPISGVDASEGVRTVCVRAADSTGLSQTDATSVSWTFDATAPVVTAFATDSGTDSTYSSFIASRFSATDVLSPVAAYCTKYKSTTAPSASDPCWQTIASPVLNPANELITARSGLGSGYFKIYLWIKDSAGNISGLSAAGLGTAGVDTYDVLHVAAPPPGVTGILAANTDAPLFPTPAPQRLIPAGQNVYIKWKADDPNGLRTNPVSLYWTTDGISFTLIAQNLDNGANGNCTVNHAGTTADDNASGCYLWANGSPSDSMYGIRVAATAAEGHIGGGLSQTINGNVDFIGGQADSGIGLSATQARMMFESKDNSVSPDAEIFDISSDGTFYYRDLALGVMYVDPADGILRRLVPLTGSATGDGGPVAGATLAKAYRVVVDYQDRILIHDATSIRRIDRTADTITRIIGGGANTADTVVGALNVQMSDLGSYVNYYQKTAALTPLPNGDIVFYSAVQSGQTAANHKIRYYNQATDTVTTVKVTGAGYSGDAAGVFDTCTVWDVAPRFTPPGNLTGYLFYYSSGTCSGRLTLTDISGVSTGPHPGTVATQQYLKVTRSGTVYSYEKSGGFKRLEPAGTWTNLLKSGTLGHCADGTAALSCDSKPLSMTEDASGHLFFIDNNKVRTIDSSGNVRTLFGRDGALGDGGRPQDATFNEIGDFNWGPGGSIIVLDRQELLIRSFNESGTVSKLAGTRINAAPGSGSNAAATGIQLYGSGQFFNLFGSDPTTGDVYMQNGTTRIRRLDNATGTWTDFVGSSTPAFQYFDAGAIGQPGNTIGISAYPSHVLGFDGSKILTYTARFSGSLVDAMLKTYTVAGAIQGHIAGTNGPVSGSWCGNGIDQSLCTIHSSLGANSSAAYDSFADRWLYKDVGNAAVRSFANGPGTTSTLATLPRTWVGIAYHRSVDLSTNTIYYCSASGSLYKYLVNTTTDIPIDTGPVRCTARKLLYDAGNDELIFAYIMNGVEGIARVRNP